jgi:hypothetical protein
MYTSKKFLENKSVMLKIEFFVEVGKINAIPYMLHNKNMIRNTNLPLLDLLPAAT